MSQIKLNCVFMFILVLAGCSGSVDSYSKTVTTHNKQVVSGVAYGSTNSLVSVVAEGVSVSADYISRSSGQFLFANVPPIQSNNGYVFSAKFADGSELYSVWTGEATASADVAVTYDNPDEANPISITANPDSFYARVMINPVTDLAYQYWLYDKQQSPYSDYVAMIFDFLMKTYGLSPLLAHKDYPSAELLSFFGKVQIIPGSNGFSVVDRATNQTCRVDYAPFLYCK